MNCAHEPCTCNHGNINRDGKTFCSEECAQSSQGNAGECRCPHPGCHKSVMNS